MSMMEVEYKRTGRLGTSANPQKLQILSPIRLPRPVVAPAALAVGINRGQTLRTSVNWTNIGTVSYAFDVMSLIGEYDPAANTFYIEYAFGLLDVSLAPGASTTSLVDGVIPDYARGGLRDGLVLICDYDPATGEVTRLYAQLLTEDAINVVGAGAEVTGVTYAAL